MSGKQKFFSAVFFSLSGPGKFPRSLPSSDAVKHVLPLKRMHINFSYRFSASSFAQKEGEIVNVGERERITKLIAELDVLRM